MPREEGIEELLSHPRALRVLYALARSEPVNMRGFIEISNLDRPEAKELREWMTEAGYLHVERLSGHGDAGVLEIRRSPFGVKVTGHLLAIHDDVKAHQARRRTTKDAS